MCKIKTHLKNHVADARSDAPYVANATASLTLFCSELGEYQTTEAEILREFAPSGAELSKEDGLRLVRSCCDKLEEQVSSLSLEHPLEALEAKI